LGLLLVNLVGLEEAAVDTLDILELFQLEVKVEVAVVEDTKMETELQL
jgi:hypothetical protein